LGQRVRDPLQAVVVGALAHELDTFAEHHTDTSRWLLDLFG
jgi:hypothetical protein